MKFRFLWTFLVFLPAAAGLAQGNLLNNPGFEQLEPTGGLPAAFRDWGGDPGQVVGLENGLYPSIGSRMFKFRATTPDGAGNGVSADVIQLVDLGGYASLVASGKARVSAFARFNRIGGNGTIDNEFRLVVRAYAGSEASFPAGPAVLGEAVATLASDGDPRTWQALSTSLVVPAGTTYVSLGLSAVENVQNDAPPAVELTGHYVDEAWVTVTPSNIEPGLYAVGDLPGGEFVSEVRDATRVGDLLLAVGGSAANAGSTNLDTAFLWTSAAGISALPNLVANTAATTPVIASAITPDGRYIASRARDSSVSGSRRAVRVTRAGLQNLALGPVTGLSGNSAATAISQDGSILYGLAGGNTRAARFPTDGSAATAIPLLNPGDAANFPAGRGTSANGSVMVGTSGADGLPKPGNRAFRYVHGSGVTAIPLLPGGTWNSALAVTPDGVFTLVAGNSTAAPFGEVYRHSSTGSSDAWGTPNGSSGVNNVGGITADGEVAVMGFSSDYAGNRPYLRNSHGWHDLADVLKGAGLSLAGWALDYASVSADGTLLFGRGTHFGNLEGWVAEVPPGYLATYAEPVQGNPVASQLVGAWAIGNSAAEGSGLVVMLPEGYFIHLEDTLPADAAEASDGLERGRFSWDPASGALSVMTLQDHNGDAGLSGLSGISGTKVTVNGDWLSFQPPGEEPQVIPRVKGDSPLVGAWLSADSDVSAGRFSLAVFLPNNTYFSAEEGPAEGGGRTGIERGTYTWDPQTGQLTTQALMDNNGDWGLNTGTIVVQVSGDVVNGAYYRVQDGDVTLGTPVVRPQDGRLEFTLEGPVGATVVTRVSTNLVNWVPLGTNVLANGRGVFFDPGPATLPARFYQGVRLP